MPLIVHLSDVHFGAHSEELESSLVADVALQRPDLVVVSGDLTQRAGRKQFAGARAFLAQLPGPVLTVAGNHDLPLFNLPRRFLTPTRRYERYISTDLDPVVAVPGLTAIGLDTMPAWRWKAGHVSPRQTALVRDAFRHTPDGAWRMIFTHHPVLPEGLSGLVGRDILTAACAEAGVAVLLSGHTHTTSMDIVTLEGSGVRRRALATVAGTAISRRTRETANSYAVIDLVGPMRTGATLTVQIRELLGGGWSTVRRQCFGYDPGGVTCAGANPT